jgi:predicted acyltransferase
LKLPGREVIIEQLEHVPWAGFHFYDLIFPLFLFIAGVSQAVAIPRRIARHGEAATARHLIFRALILFLVGVFYSGGLQKGIDNVRWLGVLQRIALGSCGAGLLSMRLSNRGLKIAFGTILVGYWALLTFVPVPGLGAADYAEGRNLTNYVDSIYLPGRKHDGDHDPEGILSTLPAIATGLLGIMAGRWISGDAAPWRKVGGLVLAGVVALAAGWLWHLQFPVIKKIWSSSFVLVAGGWSLILFGIFFAVVEIWNWRAWTKPFVWVGANPIMLYVCSGLGFFRIVGERLTGPMVGQWVWVPPLVNFMLILLVARWMYRRKVFISI